MASVSMAWAFSLDLYQELAVAHTASADEINRAYRTMVLEHHPDKSGSVEKFRSVHAARTVLLSRKLRFDYDRLLEHRRQDEQRYHDNRRAQAQQIPELYEPMDKSPLDQVVMELLQVLNPPKRADSSVRVVAGKHRQGLRGLKKLAALSSYFEICMREFTLSILDRCTQSFASMFKGQSMCGYDVQRGRTADYGNVQYKGWLYACSLSSVSFHEMLLACTTRFPTLHPLYKDTVSALNNQGDIVESMYGLCRGDDIMNILRLYETEIWRQAYTDATECFHAFDYLRCLLHGRRLKRNGDYVYKAKLRFDVADTSIVLGSIAVELGQQLA